MKTRVKILIVLAAWLQSNNVNAQFNQGLTFDYGRTNPAIEKIGIGDFTINGDVDAKLHLNHFLLGPETSTDGFLLRTDGDQDDDNRWQLFTGNDASSQTERFRIRSLSGGYDTYLERTQSGSEADVRLLAAEVQVRARGKRLGDFCELAGPLADEVIMGDGTDVNFTALSATNRRLFLHGTNGFMGIGSNFSESVLNPNYNVHVNDSLANNVLQQWTNFTTANTATDGLRVGVLTNGIAEFRNYENTLTNIHQNNLPRAQFSNVTWGGHNNATVLPNANRIFFPTSNEAYQVPFSTMQFGWIPPTLQRNWMNVGTTYGAGWDIFYVGMLESPTPTSTWGTVDAVMAWGCNDSINGPQNGPDNLRFMFITAPGTASPGAANQGLETMRITPHGDVGIGDFSVNSPGQGVGEPDYIDATLDIDGDLRIRDVSENDTLTRLLVVDQNDLNRVHWIDINDVPGQCDWNINENGSSDPANWDLVTGFDGACVERNVIIGAPTGPTTTKLFVVKSLPAATSSEIGVEVRLTGNLGQVQGVVSNASGQVNTTQTVGVLGTANTGTLCVGGRFEAGGFQQNNPMNVGVAGLGVNTGNQNTTVGVYGRATNITCGTPAPTVIGVYAQARPGTDYCTPNANAFALAVTGPNTMTHAGVLLSDASLKTNIENISEASGILGLLKPKSYEFNADAQAELSAPTGLQYGFLAQDVEEILPHLVGKMHPMINSENDSTFSAEQNEFKGIRYTEIIPLIVAGFQEQQATITAQQEAITAQQAQIEALTALVASCCSSDKSNTGSGDHTGKNGIDQGYDLNIERATLDQNVPNPFTTETSITYRIPEQATVRVRILGADGSQKDILVDGLMPRGEYRIIWNAAHLPAGMYYYTLEADGVELVKKAVKL